MKQVQSLSTPLCTYKITLIYVNQDGPWEDTFNLIATDIENAIAKVHHIHNDGIERDDFSIKTIDLLAEAEYL